jgi:hypothetical protein
MTNIIAQHPNYCFQNVHTESAHFSALATFGSSPSRRFTVAFAKSLETTRSCLKTITASGIPTLPRHVNPLFGYFYPVRQFAVMVLYGQVLVSRFTHDYHF